MIAAVLDARGVGGAHEQISALSAAVHAEPEETRAIGDAVLARWAGGVRTQIDVGSGSVVAGHVSGLASPGTPFSSDTLRGDFALARVDGATLELARGHFGGRSLYYAQSRDGARVTACSRLTPLARASAPAPAFDVERLAALASAADAPDATHTLYRGIHRLPSGTAIRLGPSGPGVMHARNLALDPSIAAGAADPVALAAELRVRIASSVARAIRGHDRVAVFVGGGIDSSALLAAAIAEARGASPKEVHALALDLDGGPGCDRPYLRALCDALGIVPVRVDAAMAARYLRDRLVYDGMPVTWPTAPMMTALHAAARDAGASVVLVGEGGDALFFGDPEAFAWEARQGRVAAAVRGALRMKLPYPTSAARRMTDLIAKPLVRRHMPRALMRRRRLAQAARYRPWAGPVMQRYLRAVAHADVAAMTQTPGEEARIRALAHSVAVTESADERSPMELFAGVEIAYPLLDDAIGALIASIPSLDLHHQGYARGLFRLAMPASIPDAIRFRQTKAGFILGIGEMVNAAGGFETLRPLATMTQCEALGLVDAKAYGRAFEALVHDPKNGDLWLPVWPALSVEALLRRPNLPAEIATPSRRPEHADD